MAYDADSVSFTLTIPPHALGSDTTVTVTPFSHLQIGGPGGDSCPGCAGSEQFCCYRGALFEPSGLVLDSPAVLHMQLPAHLAFPFAHGGLIVYLDSATKRYQPCFTTCDTSINLLRAEITHFSSYGTDDEQYERLEEAIYQTLDRAAGLVNSPLLFYAVMRDLGFLYLLCSGHGDPYAPTYDDLVAIVENQSFSVWTRFINLQRTAASDQHSCDAMFTLYPVWIGVRDYPNAYGEPFTNAADFFALSLAVKSDLQVYFSETAQRGRQLCLADSCEAGQTQLSCALTYQNVVDDQSLVDSVGIWLLACNKCGFDVAVFADKDVVHKIAVSPGDAENCIVRYSAVVHNNVTDEPAPGVSVDFFELRYPAGTRDLGSRITDQDGRCEIIVAGSDFDAECGSNLIQRVCALAFYNSKQYMSDTVSVAVRPLKIAVSVDFSASHHLSSDDLPGYLEEAAGRINGTITGPGDWVWAPGSRVNDGAGLRNAATLDSSCWEGGFSMNWTMEFADPRVPTSCTGRLLNPKSALREVAAYATDTTVMVPGTSIAIWMVTRIWTRLNFLSMPYGIEQSGVTMGHSYCDTTSADIFGGGGSCWYCFGLPTPQYPFSVINGACEPFRHSIDTLGKQSSTTITVAPVF